jgi:hypothetical protein
MPKIIIVYLCFAAVVFAQIPRKINFQGKLTDPTGIATDGSRTIVFKLFKSLAPGFDVAGDTLWSETRTVTVTKGLFDVVLGTLTP